MYPYYYIVKPYCKIKVFLTAILFYLATGLKITGWTRSPKSLKSSLHLSHHTTPKHDPKESLLPLRRLYDYDF